MSIEDPNDGMKDYLIVTAHPKLPDEIRAKGPAVGEPWKRAALRKKLMSLAQTVEERVTTKHGGRIVNDGSGYDGGSNDMIWVITTDKGLAALKTIPDIGRISEKIDLDHLLPTTGLTTNVPPGICWERPEIVDPVKHRKLPRPR